MGKYEDVKKSSLSMKWPNAKKILILFLISNHRLEYLIKKYAKLG